MLSHAGSLMETKAAAKADAVARQVSANAMTLASTIATQAHRIGTAATVGLQKQTASEILAERQRAAKSVKQALLKEKSALRMARTFKSRMENERRKRLRA